MSYWWKFLFRYTRSSVLALNGGDKKRSGSRDRATLSARGYFAFILSEIDGTPIVSTFLYRTIRTCPFHKSRSSTRYHYTPNLFQRERCWNVTIYPAFSLFLFLLTRDQVSSPRKNKILEKKAVFEEILFSYCVQIFEMNYTLEDHTHKQRKTLYVHPLETAPSLYRFSRILKKFSSSPPLQPSSSLYQAIVGWPGGHSFNIHRILRPGRFLEAFPVR